MIFFQNGVVEQSLETMLDNSKKSGIINKEILQAA